MRGFFPSIFLGPIITRDDDTRDFALLSPRGIAAMVLRRSDLRRWHLGLDAQRMDPAEALENWYSVRRGIPGE